jgi:hypothetical protein
MKYLRLSMILLSILVLLTLITVSNPAEAGQQLMKPVECWVSEAVFKDVQDRYKEKIIWTGVPKNDPDSNSTIALAVNAKTGTWTLLEFNKDNACVLGSGKGYAEPSKSSQSDPPV